jgi:hypothetical protein
MALRELTFHIEGTCLDAITQRGDQDKLRAVWAVLAGQLEPNQRVLAAWRTAQFSNDREYAIQSLEDLRFVLSGVRRHRCHNVRFLAQSVRDPLPHHEPGVHPFSN